MPLTGATAGTTAQQLIRTAERLFAMNGLDGVSLRQIATEAGSGNTSAVHYHFGSKDGLVQAIIADRLPDILRRRALLKARLDTARVRDALEAQLLPVLELAETPDNWYPSFLDQLQPAGVGRQVLDALPEVVESQDVFGDEIRLAVPQVNDAVLQMRLGDIQDFNLHAAARRQRAIGRAESDVPFALFVSTLLDGFTGYLTAPVSQQTTDASLRAPMRWTDRQSTRLL